MTDTKTKEPDLLTTGANQEIVDLGSSQASLQSEQSAAGGAQALLGIIERIARDKEVDLDRVERLYGLYNDMMRREAEIAFNDALALAQAEIEPVVRNKSNSHTKSTYADMAAITKAAQPIVAKYGLSTSFSMEDCPLPGHYRICMELARGGFSKFYRSDIPMDSAGTKGTTNKTPVQAFGSTTMYGRRYIFCMALNIATEDDNDGNRQQPEQISTINDEKASELLKLLQETNASIDGFVEFYELPPLDGDHSVATIKSRLMMIPDKYFSSAVSTVRRAAQNRKTIEEAI